MRSGALLTVLAAASVLLAGCGGMSADAKAVADACGKIPGTTVSSCECYAKELQKKLKPELMKLAVYAQTDPGKLFDPAVIGNVSANDIATVSKTAATALDTCKKTT